MFGHQFGQYFIFGLHFLLKVVDSFLLGGMGRPRFSGETPRFSQRALRSSPPR